MKKILFCFSAILIAAVQTAFSQGITTPRTPSPAAEVAQTVGISKVSVNYSRPSVKNRVVWGTIVPYGWNVQSFGAKNEAPWRAGANENTVISFSHPATVEGKLVPAGSYGLFFVINKDNSGEVILSKDSRSWGSFWYDPAHDQVRAPIKIRDVAHKELLTYEFLNLEKNSAELVLAWEKKQFPVSITFAVDDLVMANASEELKSTTGFGWQGYSSAANYALQNKVNLTQAMSWIDQAITQNKSFTTLTIKSGILRETGKIAEAEETKKMALAMATEVELNAYGYQLLGESQNDKALEAFKMATERFPKSPNAWDSLGEGYALTGDNKNAITSFKKAMSMNPPENVKINSEKYLKQLGATK